MRLNETGESITVNCILPGLTPTPLANSALLAAWPEDMLTPVSKIVEAVTTFIMDPSSTGKVAECSGNEIHYRAVLPYSNKAAEFASNAKATLSVDVEAVVHDREEKGRRFAEKLKHVSRK
jgi:NAD(P)-dependent dehydrogenase (short-subunit alcohol dehydrogenase family)